MGTNIHKFNNLYLNGFALLGRMARPSSPSAGMIIIESSTNKIIHYDGTNWRDAMGTIVQKL